jgi:Fe-S-cluster containining protein
MPKFFAEGLQFSCTSCGNCCRIPGGKVTINPSEITNLAACLKLEPTEFINQICTVKGERVQLNEQPDGACIFLRDDQCTVYEARPLQCRTFPFWPENLKSIYRWKQLNSNCPGIDSGEWHSGSKIQELMRLQKQQDKYSIE